MPEEKTKAENGLGTDAPASPAKSPSKRGKGILARVKMLDDVEAQISLEVSSWIPTVATRVCFSWHT